ncbi:MAG: peptidase, partial [Saprospiraceae bacterium]
MRTTFLIFLLLAAASQLRAQTGLPIPRNLQPAFENGTRSHNGQPGKNYWQNTADYALDVNFTPATRLISGTEIIEYTNQSPDTLRRIHFKLYPNLYKKGSPRAGMFKPEDTGDGMAIERITVNGEPQDAGAARIRGTGMDLRLRQPLLPGGLIRFAIDFSYTLNKGSHQRTGEVEEGAYFIAYFFPRIAVYDDVDGWNTNPYIGS